ncbi:MAG: DUF547 domain-containing protein [Planctomycetota bacterium]
MSLFRVFPVAALLVGCKSFVAPLDALREEGRSAPPDVELYASVLAEHVDPAGTVDYAALQSDADELERFYAQIAAVSPHSHPDSFTSEADRLAYWLNAYNAATLVSVTRLYPIESVEDLGPPWYLFFAPDTAGFFYARTQEFGGERWSLYDLEHQVVRGGFGDARIHFALNCASAGCPVLPREPFRADALDAQLEREATKFFAEPRNLEIDHEARLVRLSSILDWFAEDFLDDLTELGVEDPTVLEYAARYAPEPTAAALRGPAADYAVEYVPYDWRLNGRGLERYPVPELIDG